MVETKHPSNIGINTTKGQGLVTLRKPHLGDAGSILALKKSILGHKGNQEEGQGIYDALLPEEYTFGPEDEKAWIAASLQDPNYFIVVCAVEEEVVGILYFQSSAEKRCSHWGEVGMSVHAQWRGQGLGTLMVDALLKWVKVHPTLEKVCLKVFAANKGAYKLYKKLGFEEEGRLKNCLKLEEGHYTDAILMAKFVEK